MRLVLKSGSSLCWFVSAFWLSIFAMVTACDGGDLSRAQATEFAALEGRDARIEGLRHPEDYVVGGAIQPHWIADGSSFWFVRGEIGDDTLYVATPDESRLLTAVALDPLRKSIPDHGNDWSDTPDHVAVVEPGVTLRVWFGQRSVVSSPGSGLPRPDDISHARPAEPTNTSVNAFMYDQDLEVFDRDFDVWLRRRSTGEERRLTLDGTADERWVVYRAAPGNAVSPSGRHAVVLRVTETIWEGRRGPFIDLDAILSEWRNPTGEESGILWRPNRHREVRPFLLDIDTRTTIPVAVPSNGRECLNDAGEPHPCFAVFHLVGWLPDGSAFLLGMAEEDAHPGHFPDPHNLHDFRLLSVDPADGSVRTLVAEGPERHITGRSSGWSMGRGAWHLRDRDAFVWPSEMDGWRHLYMLNHDGKQISRITTGAFPVHRVVAVDEREGWVYFTASDDRARPYDIHLYRARFDGSGFTRLTSEPGRHSPGMQAFGVNVGIEMAPSLEYFVDTHSAPDRPPAVDLRRTDGTFVGRLDEANIDRLQTELNWTAPEEFVAKAGDGTTDLYGVLYRPPHFDPSGSYPVVEVIHDLPSGLLVEHAFNVPEKIFDSVFELRGLAEVGFVVVKVDGRGTAYRGRTFSDWSNVHGMTFISEEHAGVLHQLAANRPWMDLERVAVLGVSRGSLQALRAMAQRPDVYRAGVVVSTVAGILSDWAYTPAGVLPLIGDLTGKLMMIQGTRDGGINDVLALGDALSAAGTQYRIVLVSGGGHVMSGDALIYQNETIRDFLQTTFLANDGRPIQ